MTTRRRRVHIYPAGKLPTGTVPVPAKLRAFDQFSSELVNGEGGGSWSPADPIVFGPGLATPGLALSSIGSEFTGDIETVKGNSGGGEQEQTGIILPADSFPTFESSRSRTIVVPFVNWACTTSLSAVGGNTLDPKLFGFKALDNSLEVDTISMPFRATHKGATIVSVAFNYVVTNRRTALPTNQARFRVIRSVAFSNTWLPLHDATGSYDANGWLRDSATDPDDYWNGGNMRTVTYACNQNHSSIDPETMVYFLQFQDEEDSSGPHGNVYVNAVVTLSSIASYRPE